MKEAVTVTRQITKRWLSGRILKSLAKLTHLYEDFSFGFREMSGRGPALYLLNAFLHALSFIPSLG